MKKTNLGGARTHDLWFERQRLTPTPVRPVDTYTLYYRREETKNNRSEWCSGRALAFKTIGRGFAPRQPVFFSNVGDAFASWPWFMYDLPRRTTALSFLAPRHMIGKLKRVAYIFTRRPFSLYNSDTLDALQFWMTAPYPLHHYDLLVLLCDIPLINWNASPTSRLKMTKRWRGTNSFMVQGPL